MICAHPLLFAVGIFIGNFVGGTTGPDIIGSWARQDGGTRITISPCGDAVCAVNTWVREPNGDERLGDSLVMTLNPESPTVLSGQAYDKRRNTTYSMSVVLRPPGMRTSGCVFFGILCKTAEWHRIQ